MTRDGSKAKRKKEMEKEGLWMGWWVWSTRYENKKKGERNETKRSRKMTLFIKALVSHLHLSGIPCTRALHVTPLRRFVFPFRSVLSSALSTMSAPSSSSPSTASGGAAAGAGAAAAADAPALPAMPHALLGNSGLVVSRLSYGAWVSFGNQLDVDKAVGDASSSDSAYSLMVAAFKGGFIWINL